MDTDNRTSISAQPDYELFVFGDSLSDTGNLSRRTLGLIPLSPPYFEGRFSNGPVAVETLAEQLGLAFSQSTNFAIGGARTGRTNTSDNDFLKFGGLLDQIDQFKTQASTLDAGAEDLYVVWAGANDFLSQPSDPTAAVNTAVSNISTAIAALAQSGAKNIIVAKTPNLGRVPLALQEGRSQALTNISNAFNSTLETTLNALEQSLTNTNIVLVDLYTTAESVAQNPAEFGFSNIDTAFLNGLIPKDLSANPDQFFFWDQVHPTTRGHSTFADTFRRTIITNISDNVTRVGTVAADKLVGFSGNDLLRGLGGNDVLEGNAGIDVLLGGSEADTLVGGGNRDELTGGADQDFLRGGLGGDRFIYKRSDDGRDIIADFQPGIDVIDIKTVVSGSGYDRPNPFAAYVRLLQTSDGAVVRVDANGDAVGGFKAMALLSAVSVNDLSASSFLVS